METSAWLLVSAVWAAAPIAAGLGLDGLKLVHHVRRGVCHRYLGIRFLLTIGLTAVGITARLALIQKAAVKDWRAAAWLLERDLPDAFSLKYRVEHSAEPTSVAEFFRRATARADKNHELLEQPGRLKGGT